MLTLDNADNYGMMVEKEMSMVAVYDDRSDHAVVQCRMCEKNYLLMYNREDMLDWLTKRDFIQYCMPYLSASERELLISGTCGDCFDKLFPPPDVDIDY